MGNRKFSSFDSQTTFRSFPSLGSIEKSDEYVINQPNGTYSEEKLKIDSLNEICKKIPNHITTHLKLIQ